MVIKARIPLYNPKKRRDKTTRKDISLQANSEITLNGMIAKNIKGIICERNPIDR